MTMAMANQSADFEISGEFCDLQQVGRGGFGKAQKSSEPKMSGNEGNAWKC